MMLTQQRQFPDPCSNNIVVGILQRLRSIFCATLTTAEVDRSISRSLMGGNVITVVREKEVLELSLGLARKVQIDLSPKVAFG
jgi:hypothetical protein